jgi:tetratricopeptide (TPR) repeat protein
MDNVDGVMALVSSRLEQGEFAAAEALARRAIALDRSRAAAWANLGVSLALQDRHADAASAFEHAMQLESHDHIDSDTFVNAANNQRDSDNVQAALALYEANLAQYPSHHGHAEYGISLLMAGRLAEGWDHYEFRWMRDPLLSLRPKFRKPVWAGQDLEGKTLLLRGEQGMGDTIQFIRYAPYLQTLGAKVLLIVQEGFGCLAARFPGVDTLIGRDDALPPIDFYIHLLSLPRVFRTDLASIPADVPYLQAEPAAVTRWAGRLGAPKGHLKVGLVWGGNATYSRDRHRSLPLRLLAPLGSLPGVRYFGLQKGSQAAETETSPINAEFVNLGSEFQDFGDTAAAIAHLDLVISVDTAVAHLAAAQGKPVWLLLPRPADFRWMRERDDSPWYPTMRLFRQDQPGDWSAVIERVTAALEQSLRGGDESVASKANAQTPVPRQTLARLSPDHKPGFSAVAETRAGIVQYFPDEAIAGDSIDWYGEYLQGQLDVLGRIIKPGMTVIEVDPGVGTHALHLAQTVGPSGQVYLYESRPLMQKVLRQNLAVNRVGNVTVVTPAPRRASASSAEAPVESIDGLHLQQLHLLKLGQHTAVADVLAGASETLWRLRPLLFIPVADERELSGVALEVANFGYRCGRIGTSLFSPANFNRREDDIFAGREAVALIGVPEEIEFDMALAGSTELVWPNPQ